MYAPLLSILLSSRHHGKPHSNSRTWIAQRLVALKQQRNSNAKIYLLDLIHLQLLGEPLFIPRLPKLRKRTMKNGISQKIQEILKTATIDRPVIAHYLLAGTRK
jgi:hypothetical protein